MVDMKFWKLYDIRIILYSTAVKVADYEFDIRFSEFSDFRMSQYSFGSKKNYEKKIPDFLVLFSKLGAILDFLLDQTQF